MSTVGNDVVDLDDPAIELSHLRERFVRRVCHDSELEQLARAPSRKVRLWSLFAAKEAAYKAVTRLGLMPGFAHQSLIVSEDLRSVRFQDQVLSLEVTVEGPCVHAVAWQGDRVPISHVETKPPEANPSVAVRELVARRLGEGHQVERAEAPGSWDGRGPPTLSRHGKPLPLDVSLSHDGRFVAFAVAPRS